MVVCLLINPVTHLFVYHCICSSDGDAISVTWCLHFYVEGLVCLCVCVCVCVCVCTEAATGNQT